MERLLFFPLLCLLSSLLACPEEPVSHFMGPQLLANSPVHFGDSPKGVRQSGRLVITNGGDGALQITDFQVLPTDGVFQVAISELPLTVNGRRSKEIVMVFRPPEVGSFRSELVFNSNHEGDTLSPIVLIGNGISNEACLPCPPPPAPECHLDLSSSIMFVPNEGTDCDSDNGICSYTQIEKVCAPLLCDPETGLCPGHSVPVFDAGPQAICGDGIQNSDEECDDGNTDDGDGCSATCMVEAGWDCTQEPCESICGDGQMVGDEECDDGNTDDGDGCSAACTIENGWDCDDAPCEPICGDGQMVGDEECDDGNTAHELCAYGATACTICGPTCVFVSGIAQNCGDGTLQAEEACDDGESIDGGIGNSNSMPDACREDCTAPSCGDGVQDGNEECDDGNTEVEACDYGETECSVCGNLCTVVPGITQNCGDGALQGSEECDDGTAEDGGVGNSNSETDACRENCTEAYCGDSVQDSEEACDPGSTVDLFCAYGAPSCFVCNEDCEQVDGWAQFCGDGMMQEVEECDHGTDPVNGNSNERADACRITCVAASCGDGCVDTGEPCDDGDNDPGDGCGTDCIVEDGWECTGSPSVCTPVTTGDPGETCENANPLIGSGGNVTAPFGVNDDLRPANYNNASCADGYESADGPEVVYTVTLDPGDTFSVTNAVRTNPSSLANCTTMPHTCIDISIYLLDDCDTNNGTCVAGADERFEDEEESFSYLNSASQADTFFLVIDAWCHSDYCPTPSDTFNFTWAVIPSM